MLKREDYTHTLSEEERRLDAFAKLLSGNSECVALALIQGKIYISSNSLSSSSRTDDESAGKNFSTITRVVSFFRKVATGQQVADSERKQIFSEVCAGSSRFKESFAEGLAQQVADAVWGGHNPTMRELKEAYKTDDEMASRMYSKFMDLREDFLKIFQFIISNPDSELPKALADQNGCVVLTEEPSPKIHAEVQILAKLINLLETFQGADKFHGDIYFGISKLCCLHCQNMLEAANHELTQRSIQIQLKTRGYHNISFDQNWNPPAIFSTGYNDVKRPTRAANQRTELEKASIPYVIGALSRQKIALELEKKHEGHVSMSQSESESESGKLTQDRLVEQQNEIQSRLQYLNELHQHETSIEDAIRESEQALKEHEIAVALHAINEFHQLSGLLRGVKLQDEVLQRYFVIIFDGIKTAGHLLESEKSQFLDILKNAGLAGSSIANGFQRFSILDGMLVPIVNQEQAGKQSLPNVSLAQRMDVLNEQLLADSTNFSDIDTEHVAQHVLTPQRNRSESENSGDENQAKRPRLESPQQTVSPKNQYKK